MSVAGPAHALAVAAGIVGLAWVLRSAVRTVVIPRPERVALTDATLETSRRIVQLVGGRIGDADLRHRLLGTFGPAVLLVLPMLWSVRGGHLVRRRVLGAGHR